MRTLLASLVACTLTSLAGATPSPDSLAEVRISLEGSQLRATVIGVPRAPASHLTLRDGEKGQPIPATAVYSFREGPDTVALAVVYAGGEIAVGNDDFEAYDSPARYPGFLKDLKKGLDGAKLAELYPPGSMAVAIEYDTGSRAIVPMGPIANLTGDRLGSQRDHYNRLGTDLVAGIESAITELAKVSVARRALIVVGDGNDTNSDLSIDAFARLRRTAKVEAIETFAIVHKGALSDPATAITKFTSNARVVASAEAIPAAIASITNGIADRYYVTFPRDALAHDGLDHELSLAIDGQVVAEPATLNVPEQPAVSSIPSGAWWIQLAIGSALVALIALGTWIASRRTKS